MRFSRPITKIIFSALFAASVSTLSYANGLIHPELKGSYVGLTYPQSTLAGGETVEPLKPANHQGDHDMRLTVGHPWQSGVHLEYGLQQMQMASTSLSSNGTASEVMRMQAGSISTMFFLPGASDIYPFFKVGVAAISAGVEQDFVGSAIGSIGVIYPLTKGWSARLEIEHINRFGASGVRRTQAYAGIQIPL